jgi:hypothetical protein
LALWTACLQSMLEDRFSTWVEETAKLVHCRFVEWREIDPVIDRDALQKG